MNGGGNGQARGGKLYATKPIGKAKPLKSLPIPKRPDLDAPVPRIGNPLPAREKGDAQPAATAYPARMHPIRALLAPALLALMALPAAAEKISLDQLSAYINGFSTAQSGFTQINADGSKSKGTIFIKRPGRARFEYAKPDDSLVIAGGGQVAIFDPKSNNPPEQFPLRRTPLNLILAAKVDLARARMVVGYGADDKTTIVEAQDPDHPDYGTIKLYFSPNPITLRKWVITDGGGGQTTVMLSGLEQGGSFPERYFDITAETNKRAGN